MEDLINLLNRATGDELKLLARILSDCDPNPSDVTTRLTKVSSSFLAHTVLKERLSYRQVVERVAAQLGVSASGVTTPSLERDIAARFWTLAWDRMTPDQRGRFNQELVKLSEESQIPELKCLAVAGGGLALAKASGFGVYLLTSSTLGALSATVGFALPFGVYRRSRARFRSRSGLWVS